MEEQWRTINGYEGYYEISSLGRVRSVSRVILLGNNRKQNLKGRILKTRVNDRGYVYVGLSKEGKRKSLRVHRLVAEAFLKNPFNKPQINHINEIKTDNTVSNLEWVTQEENMNHGTRKERMIKSLKNSLNPN